VAKVVCVLYPDPVDGYPKTYARDGVPEIARYPGGQTTPTPRLVLDAEGGSRSPKRMVAGKTATPDRTSTASSPTRMAN